MCHQGASSAWYADANALAGKMQYAEILRPTNTMEEAWDLFDTLIPSLEEIYILGGEPLLEIGNYNLLQKLIAQKRTDIRVKFSTNLSSVSGLGEKILNLLQLFPNKLFLLSYDGEGEVGEFIRKGTLWSSVVNNHKKLLNTIREEDFIIVTTVSLLNVFHLCDFIMYLIKEKIITNARQLALSVLREPKYFNVKLLTTSQLELLEENINRFVLLDLPKLNLANHEAIIFQLKKIIAFIKMPKERDFDVALERKKFVIHNTHLDKLRGEKTLAILPEFQDFYFDTYLSNRD
jgi:hypothetical protein